MAMNTTGAGAYAAVANLTNPLKGGTENFGAARGATGFGDIVETVLSNVQKTGEMTEAQGEKVANGNAEVLDLVTAVAETELAVETLVTVRDRVISAYQDILNMPI